MGKSQYRQKHNTMSGRIPDDMAEGMNLVEDEMIEQWLKEIRLNPDAFAVLTTRRCTAARFTGYDSDLMKLYFTATAGEVDNSVVGPYLREGYAAAIQEWEEPPDYESSDAVNAAATLVTVPEDTLIGTGFEVDYENTPAGTWGVTWNVYHNGVFLKQVAKTDTVASKVYLTYSDVGLTLPGSVELLSESTVAIDGGLKYSHQRQFDFDSQTIADGASELIYLDTVNAYTGYQSSLVVVERVTAGASTSITVNIDIIH